MDRLSLEQGTFLVRLARSTVENYLERGQAPKPACPEWGTRPRGAFVTLATFPARQLRGCVGYVSPATPLAEMVCEAALLAAFADTRFEPLGKKEVGQVVFETSVLTPPKRLATALPADRPAHIEIGRHGLIVTQGMRSGLLLPQVPKEFGWREEEFLSHACLKAGLPPDAWLSGATQVFLFEAQVFSEKEPGGEVEEKGEH
ncbi:MAG: TIGR00296 family protein [Candidatus Micrarchaeia archaeon]